MEMKKLDKKYLIANAQTPKPEYAKKIAIIPVRIETPISIEDNSLKRKDCMKTAL
jgi:hypothetical protein